MTKPLLNNVPGKRWSPSEVQRLVKWYTIEGRSREAIALGVGRTIMAVDNKIERLKLTRRNRPQKVLPKTSAKQPWLKSREDFIEFLGMELWPYQWEGWDLIAGNSRTILCWNRQAGKDMLLSLYALYLSLTVPRTQVVCVSPSDRQSKLWMVKVQDFAFGKKEIQNLIVDKSKSEISFTNGSRLTSVPGGMEAAYSIRGFSNVSLLIFNEAAYVNEDVFHGTTPFLAASGEAKIVLISTPFGTLGYYFRQWESDLYAKSLVTADMCPHIRSEFLEDERKSMPALKYASEYECQFLSSQTAFFPTELLAAVTKTYGLTELPPAEYEDYKFYLGFDPARVKGGDKSVLTIIAEKDGNAIVLWLKEFEDVSYVDQCSYVANLYADWRFKQIFVDKSSFHVVDALLALRLPVTAISFSMQGKIELYGRLKASMESGSIIIPVHPNLAQELATFEYRITESGNMTLHGTGHDDYCDSLALAASELTKPRVGLSATLVDQTALAGQGAVISMSEWKETFMWRDVQKGKTPKERVYIPGAKEELCMCELVIKGPRMLINGLVYVDANHPECAEKARKFLVPPVSK